MNPVHRLILEALEMLAVIEKPGTSVIVTRQATSMQECESRKLLVEVTNLLTLRTTKLSLLKGTSRDTPELCADISKCLARLTNFIHQFPNTLGNTVLLDLKSNISSIIFDIVSLANALLENPMDQEIARFRSSSHFIQTGIFWQSAEAFKKIPLNNRDAVICKLTGQEELIGDALDEMESSACNESSSKCDDGWNDLLMDGEVQANSSITPFTDNEINQVGKCFTLVKYAKATVTKVIRIIAHMDVDALLAAQLESLSLNNHLSENILLDDLVPASEIISERVDDLACLIESPLPIYQINGTAAAVTDAVLSLLDLCKAQHISVSDSKWLDTMTKKIERLLESFAINDR